MKTRVTKRTVLTLFLFTFCAFIPHYAEGQSSLPSITRLDTRDESFRQFISDVEAARRLMFSNRQDRFEDLISSLTIYSYTPAEGEELIAIAARCSIPYGTLATLNRFSHFDDMKTGKPLLLPSAPGIFIPETPGTDFESLLYSSRQGGALLSIPREGRIERFRFIPGDDFSQTERIFFLNREFRSPLRQFRVTSNYGPRVNPVTGVRGVHQGLDLAAPEGTEVYAVRGGTVAALGEDPVLGKYVIVSHENNWVSLYGHLSAVTTTLRAAVQPGSIIGRVGSTGQSTGPHLHFELRQNGQTRDPARLIGIFRGSAPR